MKVQPARRVFLRLWMVSIAVWLLVFGYRAYSAYSEFSYASNQVRVSNVMGSLLEAGGSSVDYNDPNFGEAAVSGLETRAAQAEEHFDSSLRLLILGLVVGSLSIGAIYWIIRGAAEDASERSQP